MRGIFINLLARHTSITSFLIYYLLFDEKNNLVFPLICLIKICILIADSLEKFLSDSHLLISCLLQ